METIPSKRAARSSGKDSGKDSIVLENTDLSMVASP